jgi:hypothetical protein
MDQATAEMIAERAHDLMTEIGGTYGGYRTVNFEGGTGHLIVDLKGDGKKDNIMISVKQSKGLLIADTTRGSNAIVRNTFGDQTSLIWYILSF